MGKPRSELFGIPDKEIARICCVSLKTAQRWKHGQSVPPEAAIIVLRLLYYGDLAVLGPEWDGWTYRDGTLTSPDGLRINRNDALSVPFLLGHISALKAQVAELEAREETLEEQPTPAEWPVLTA